MLLDDPRFSLTPSGRFRERHGPHGRRGVSSSKKLCLVATDPEFLIDLLYGLSLRQDCCYVKYGTVCREGMYLGRCFLATDEAASLLCQELKGHPRLMASLQDDAWFAAFRRPRVPSESFGIWDGSPDQGAQVVELVETAFGGSDPAKRVVALRQAGAVTVSLIAQIPPEHRDREPWPIVGHVLLSPVTIDGSAAPRGLELASLAVTAAHRRRGIGSSLLAASLRRASLLGYSYVIASGHLPGASRLGFVPAPQLGLRHPPTPGESTLMACELAFGALAGVWLAPRHHPPLSR
jgi:putative acetyltransferase